LTVNYADGRTMTYRAQLPIAVKSVREGTLLFDVASDVEAMARAARERPGEFVVRLLQEKTAPVASKDIRAELGDLGVVEAGDGDWWKLAQRDLKTDPHVVITGSKYAWSAAPAAVQAGRAAVGARRVASPEELLGQAATAGRGDGVNAARVRHEVTRAAAQGRFPAHLAPLARAVHDPASLTGADLPGELLDEIPAELAPLVLTAGRRMGDSRVVLGAWLLAREDRDREAAQEILARRAPEELATAWGDWVARRAGQIGPQQRCAEHLDRFLDQGQRLMDLALPAAAVLSGLLELLAALSKPMAAGPSPQSYDEALDWIRAEVRNRARDAGQLGAALDLVAAGVPAAVGTAALLGVDWSPTGLRRRWVLALAASAHRDVLDDPRTWEAISLHDVAQPGSQDLARHLLESRPGPGLVEALLDGALEHPSARAVGLVLTLDPALLATVRPASFARALAALAVVDGPARELIAAYDSYVRTGLRLEHPTAPTGTPR
jgi:hypothetical protein